MLTLQAATPPIAFAMTTLSAAFPGLVPFTDAAAAVLRSALIAALGLDASDAAAVQLTLSDYQVSASLDMQPAPSSAAELAPLAAALSAALRLAGAQQLSMAPLGGGNSTRRSRQRRRGVLSTAGAAATVVTNGFGADAGAAVAVAARMASAVSTVSANGTAPAAALVAPPVLSAIVSISLRAGVAGAGGARIDAGTVQAALALPALQPAALSAVTALSPAAPPSASHPPAAPFPLPATVVRLQPPSRARGISVAAGAAAAGAAALCCCACCAVARSRARSRAAIPASVVMGDEAEEAAAAKAAELLRDATERRDSLFRLLAGDAAPPDSLAVPRVSAGAVGRRAALAAAVASAAVPRRSQLLALAPPPADEAAASPSRWARLFAAGWAEEDASGTAPVGPSRLTGLRSLVAGMPALKPTLVRGETLVRDALAATDGRRRAKMATELDL